MSYEFTLWVRPGTSDPDAWANAVYEAGGDDTLVGSQDYICFDREAASFDEAVRSALRTVLQAGGHVNRLEVPEEQLAWAAQQQTTVSYLSENLQYHLGPAERNGLKLFYELAAGLGLAPAGVELVFRA